MTPSPLPFQTEVASLMQHLRQSVQGDKILQLPLTIGQYKVKSLVGRGGMGDVYEAENLLLKRSEAIKFVRSKLTLNPEAIERFKTEIESTAQLQHPNIVTVYNAGEYEGRPYMVMEFLHGQTVHQFVQQRIQDKNPVTLQEAIDIIVQAAHGLQYAHEKGFIHRDIKPGNLWIAPDKTVKVLDLGLVSPTQRGTKGYRVVGTPDFMSPEQCLRSERREARSEIDESSFELSSNLESNTLDKRNAKSRFSPLASRFSTVHLTPDPRSDIYSLGCTFFYILTGHVPFGGKEFSTSDKKMEAQRTCSLPPLNQYRKELPRRIQKILNRMTAKHPEERYASMNDVIEAFSAKPVSKSLILTVTGLALLGGTCWGLQYSNIQSDKEIQTIQDKNISVPDIIAPFPVGKQAGEKLVRAVDGVEYVFRWCPPGEFLMGDEIVISKKMSFQELLELATEKHLLEDKELLAFQQLADKIVKSEISQREKSLQQRTLKIKLYSKLAIHRNVSEGVSPQKVSISHGFWILDCEVTRQMWFSVMPASSANNSIISFNELENAPVRNISWNDSQEFCRNLSHKLNVDVQLLTNAQWEYACKAGTEETEELINSQAISLHDNLSNPAVVRSKSPNAWGIYDMPGNVWELCAETDCSLINSKSQTNSIEPSRLTVILRGGSYLTNTKNNSFFSDYIYKIDNERIENAGFRFCVFPK